MQLQIMNLMEEEDSLLAANDATPQFPVGTTYQLPAANATYGLGRGAIVQYLQFNDGAQDTALAAGHPVGIYMPSGGTPVGSPGLVTNDRSDSGDTQSAFVGIALGAITSTYYGWFCIEGPCEANIDNTGAVAIADPIYWSADLELDKATVGSHHIIAHALDAVASGDGTRSKVSVLLNRCGAALA